MLLGLTTSRFVHEPTLRAVYERLYSSGNGSGIGQDNLALVYMVLGLGSHYSKTWNAFCGFMASRQLYQMACQEIDKNSKVTLSSLQARLLMFHFLLNHSRMHDAWSSFGILVRQAQALGLHRHWAGRPASHVEREYRKRVFWTILIYDRIFSSIFGRPCVLHDDDIDQEECVLVNDDELAGILGVVLREFYSHRKKKKTLHSMRSIAPDLQGRLLSWQKELPAYLHYASLPSFAMSTMIQRQMCTLKLTLAHTSLLLYRPFTLHSFRLDADVSDDLREWFEECGDYSIEAAKVIVNEWDDLYKRGFFSRAFWFVNYAQFAAIGTLYMHSCPPAQSSSSRAG